MYRNQYMFSQTIWVVNEFKQPAIVMDSFVLQNSISCKENNFQSQLLTCLEKD